jgi:tetratricopeptide (TPR) repeat protein
VLQWKLDEAEPLLKELLPALRAIPPERRGIPISGVMARLAHVRYFQGDREGGLTLARESLAAAKTDGTSGLDDLVQRTTVTAAVVLSSGNKLDEAERLFRRALAEARTTLGRSHRESLRIGTQLAQLLLRRNRPREALELWKEWLTYSRDHYWNEGAWKDSGGWGHAWLLMIVAKLAALSGRPDEAGPAYAEAISLLRRQVGDSDPRCQELWRNWTMLLGLGSEGPWASEAIRTQVRRVAADSLTSHPTTSFAPDELQWNHLRFRLARWDPQAGTPAGGAGPLGAIEGGLPQLKSLPEPEPGLYLLSLEVPRNGGGPLSEASWMLVSHWNLELYDVDFVQGSVEDQWHRRLASAPDERRREPALALEGWWATGFGPMNQENSFGIVATTTIEVPAGVYRFLVTASDGARLWIDDQLKIDSWIKRPSTTDAAIVQLSEGPHRVRLDYFQAGGVSLVWVRAEPQDYRAGEMRALPLGGNP